MRSHFHCPPLAPAASACRRHAPSVALPAPHPWRLPLLGLAAAIPLLLGAVLAQAQVLYTADEHGNSISAIELASGRVTTLPVKISPHNVQITPDGTRLLAVGEPVAEDHGHGHDSAAPATTEAAGLLLVFDAAALDAGPVAEIPVGAHPAHVVADPRGERAFVTNAGDNSVSVVDLASNTVIATIGTGRYPHGLRPSPDGRQLFVANVQDGSLSVIDTEALVELTRIPVGRAPVQVGFTPDGALVYASLRDENRVAVVDTASRRIVATIAVGRNPIQVHATPDGRFVYVANQGSESEPADTVSVIDVASGRVIDTIRTGAGAHGVAVSNDGDFAFVTNIVAATVSVIDTATHRVVASFPVGRGPNGITYRPAADETGGQLKRKGEGS